MPWAPACPRRSSRATSRNRSDSSRRRARTAVSPTSISALRAPRSAAPLAARRRRAAAGSPARTPGRLRCAALPTPATIRRRCRWRRAGPSTSIDTQAAWLNGPGKKGRAAPLSGVALGPGTFLCRKPSKRRHTRRPVMSATKIGKPAISAEDPSDEELVRNALARDASAFRAIMTRYNQRLYRLARSIVGRSAEAEDVVQEAYVRAFRNLGTFRGDAALSTWLSRIVINEALGRLRKAKREGKATASYAAQAEIIRFPGIDDPERTMAQRQILNLVE